MTKESVIFFKHKTNGDLFAYFFERNYNVKLYGNDVKESYSHIGQHSPCHKDYLFECERAKPEEYKDLYFELESIGYKLEDFTHKK